MKAFLVISQDGSVITRHGVVLAYTEYEAREVVRQSTPRIDIFTFIDITNPIFVRFDGDSEVEPEPPLIRR